MISTQINYTLTYFADHTRRWSHDTMNRYLQENKITPGLTTGKPVVATDVGGFSEMIQHGETGTLVEYGNEEQLAKELVDLLQDPERLKQVGQNAREMVKTEYSWDAISRKTLECYKNVISKL